MWRMPRRVAAAAAFANGVHKGRFSVATLLVAIYPIYCFCSVRAINETHFTDSSSQLLERFLKYGSKPSSIAVDDALLLFEAMVHRQPLPSIWAFNKLLTALARGKHYPTAISQYKKMGCLPIQPSIYTLNIAINCFCCLSKAAFGFSLLGTILKLGYEPDAVSFNTLIRGLCVEEKID
uniref:Pentatricopeptide repeat-containing protein n=1 Tax=Nelumbo nucifera TaxID=4432 RepID=A0A822Z8Q8_NELNU|nr:TPA_asm: hypothetical protein HUJ06_014062 [Nelumbo nucifera]